MSVNFELLAQSHAKLCLFKVQKLDVSIRPLFPNPVTIDPCSEAECSDEQDDDKDQTITNMEDEVIAVTISHSVPVTSVITTHHDHNLSLPTHHHHHHCIQHSSKGYFPYHVCIVCV